MEPLLSKEEIIDLEVGRDASIEFVALKTHFSICLTQDL